MRSRAVFLPRACCFSTARAEPACTASSMRSSRSAILPAVLWMSGAGAVEPRSTSVAVTFAMVASDRAWPDVRPLDPSPTTRPERPLPAARPVHARRTYRTRPYRPPTPVVTSDVSGSSSWIALLGVILILGGVTLLISAIGAGRRARKRARRRSDQERSGSARRGGGPIRDGRAFHDRQPARARALPPAANRRYQPPDRSVRRSALLADTVPLRQIPPSQVSPSQVSPSQVSPSQVLPSQLPPQVGALEGPTLPLISVTWYETRPPR